MRNLKRALSLALASVMLLGMMVVGTSASFKDVGPEHNTEAIAVAEMLELMVGSGDGNFLPDKTVTREEMAGVLAKLLLLDVDHFNGVSNFTDVAPGQWYAPAIAACAADGFFAGIGGGKFGLGTEMTVNQVGLLLCKVLGYFQTAGDYGEDADLAATLQASKAGLFSGLDKANKDAPITRNQMVQMCLNALKATKVEKKAGTGVTVTTPDVTVSTGAAEYAELEIKDPKYAAVKPGGDGEADTAYTVELGEEVYDGDLKLIDNGKADDFKRPGKTWTYDGKEVAAAEEPVAVFTGATSAKNVASALKGYTVYVKLNSGTSGQKAVSNTGSYTGDDKIQKDDKTEKFVVVDGGEAGNISAFDGDKVKTTAAAIAKETANGKLVEIYANSKKEITAIVEVKYIVEQVTGIKEKDGDVTYTLSVTSGNKVDYAADSDEDDEIVINGTVEEDDYVTTTTVGDVVYVYPTTKVVGAQSAKTSDGVITVSGTKYTVGDGVYTNSGKSAAVSADTFGNSKDDANYYIDQYGFVVKTDSISSDTYDYAVVDRIALVKGRGTEAAQTVEARLALADGSVVTVNVTKINGLATDDENKIKPEGTKGNVNFYKSDSEETKIEDVDNIKMSDSYTDNEKLSGLIVTYEADGNDYEIKYLGTKADKISTEKNVIVKNSPAITGTDADHTYSGNNKTVYLVRTGDNKYTSYTGFQNVISVSANTSAKDVLVDAAVKGKAAVKNSVVDFVYVDARTADSTGDQEIGDMFYVTETKFEVSGTGKDQVVTLKGILNGKEGEIQFKGSDNVDADGKTAKGNLKTLIDEKTNKLFELTMKDGYVDGVEKQDGSHAYKTQVLAADAEEGVVGSYAYDGSETVYVIDGNELVGGTVENSAKTGDTIYVKTVGSSGADQSKVDIIYIIKAAE